MVSLGFARPGAARSTASSAPSGADRDGLRSERRIPTVNAFDVDVALRPDSAAVTVTVRGELDLATCPRVVRATETIPLEGRTLTLELSAVTFMDPSGLNMLLGLRERARAEGGALYLAGVPDQARTVLDLTGTGDLFPLRP
ncbi:hypothetical protein Slala02_03930 [Streptomyces lavendulae subsp. lavendulae]|nr:hypothetical protein Slala01_12100 [Streptomyces lavendulae subsp. lavendulae]GLX24573.1 hypothetical protein Slala02_03930 [Streptomyces lavendulae subsp. lavendulae]